MIIWRAKYFRLFLMASILVVVAIFFARQINFTSSDLGRHIKNGEMITHHPTHLSTNYYSYTEPEHPVNTHHWGAGVIFYIIWLLGSFKALSVLNIAIHLLALCFFVRAARLNASFKFTILLTILCIPLITYRTEIRPEGFSYLLFGLLLYLYELFNNGRINRKWLYLVPLIQVFWVNVHIFFIFGLFLSGIYLINYLFVNKDKVKAHLFIKILLLSIAASFVSPFGYKAFIEPFMIFREYGYMIAENQSVLFMQNRFPANPVFWYFEAIFLVASLIFFVLLLKEGFRGHFSKLVLFLVFSLFAWSMVRGIAFWGFILIPLGASQADSIEGLIGNKWKKIIRVGMVLVYAVIFALMVLRQPLFFPDTRITGLGLFPGSNSSALFFKQAKLRGPIFNNYDIGSYLIFHLFPNHRVFIDNRPEAYSSSFLKDYYVPMQENNEMWDQMMNKYQFNVIFYYRHDMTPWGQPFLIKRVRDPEWAPVYVDDYTLIMVKRNLQNRGLIERFELPQSMFSAN